MKRAFDLVAAALGLVVLWPVILAAVIAIRLNSPGPAILAQRRIGQGGREFTCYKLRTMHLNTPQLPTHQVGASALTSIGGFLRRSKLDELPQLYNVLRGDMSLVGPRPCLPSQSDLIQTRSKYGALRVLPGITGLAQIYGIDMSNPVRLARIDGIYVRQRSFLGDLLLLLQTMRGSGVGIDAVELIPNRKAQFSNDTRSSRRILSPVAEARIPNSGGVREPLRSTTSDYASFQQRSIMAIKRNRTAFLLAAATVIAMIGAACSIDLGRFAAVLVALDPRPLAAAILLTIIALFVAYLRFDWTMRALYPGRIPRRPAISAFVLGNLASHLLFNIFGQSFTRAAILQSHGIPVSVTISATYIERLGALITLGLAATAAMFVLFGTIHVDFLQGGDRLLQLAVGGPIVLVAGLSWASAKLVTREGLRETIALGARLTPTALLGLAIHLAYFTVYWVLIRPFAIEIDALSLAAAIIVVMFVASIPISLSGWGLREFSAAYVMSAIGVPTEPAVLMAIIIGVLSLLVSIASGGAVLFIGSPAAIPEKDAASGPSPISIRSDATLIWVVSVLTASLVLVQARIHVGATELTINAADPFALTAFMLAAYFAWQHRLLDRVPPGLLWGTVGVAMALLFGVGVAWVHFGGSSWTFFNRLFGYIFLLGYLSIGSLVAVVASESGRTIIIGTFLTSTAAIMLLQIAVSFAGASLQIAGSLIPALPEGLAQNRNAFAFQLLMAFCAAFSLFDSSQSIGRRSSVIFILIAITALVFFTGSRSAAVIAAFGFLAAIALQANWVPQSFLRMLYRWPRSAAAVLVAIALIGHIAVSALTGRFVHSSRVLDDMQRWRTVSEGISMWWENPVLGSGLGAYIARHQNQLVNVIHSVPVWFLAELGLLGLACYFLFLVGVASEGIAISARAGSRARGFALLLSVAFFTVMGLAHDMFFQRAFWFVLGLLAAAGAAKEDDDAYGRRAGFCHGKQSTAQPI